MKLLPVLDLLEGRAVRAMGGIRQDYQPLRVSGCRSACPLEISRVLRDRYELDEWYVADLDGIVHRRWNLGVLQELRTSGLSLRIDWGLSDVEDMFLLAGQLEGTRCIVSSEALKDCSVLDALVGMLDPSQMSFSLDLVEGELKAPPGAWGGMTLEEIVGYVQERGITEVVVLDLAYVGCTRGLGTSRCCARLRERFPDLHLLTGGGVRTAGQLRELDVIGVNGVLLASCLHRGELTPEDLACYHAREKKVGG